MADPSIRTPDPGTARARPELLVVGAASRDIDARDARGWRLGGTVSYAALAAARLGIAVRALIGADAEAATAHELDPLREAGVEIVIAPLAHGPVYENRQFGNARRQFVHGVSDRIPITALPDDWRQPSAVLLGPVADELGDEWSEIVPDSSLVTLAWQGILREVIAGQPVRLKPPVVTPLVHRSDVLFVSAEDIAAGAPPIDSLIHDAQELFVTAGQHGAVHIRRATGARRISLVPVRPRRTPVDTTGAGDTFLAAYVAARLAAPQLVGTDEEWRLHAIAAATASLVVAATGLDAVPTLREVCAALLTPQS